MVFFRAVALDLDGTLTSRGDLSAEAPDAIDEVRRDGVVVILVSGRIAAELQAEFPQIADHGDASVLENGRLQLSMERLMDYRRPWMPHSTSRNSR